MENNVENSISHYGKQHQPLWKTEWKTACKTAWGFLKILKTEVSYDLIITLLGICPKKIKSLSQSDIYTPLFITALFTAAKIWKGLRVHEQI